MNGKTVMIGLLISVAARGGMLAAQETRPIPGSGDVLYWNGGDGGEDYFIQFNDDERHAGMAGLGPHVPPGMPVVRPFPQEGNAFYVRTHEGGMRLGILIADINDEKAKELKLSGEYGVLVKEVREGSPAANAGLMKDDVILEFAGDKIRSAAQLRRMVRETAPDRSVAIVVSREGQRKTLTAKVEAAQGPEPGIGNFNVHVPPPNIQMPRFDSTMPRFNFAWAGHGARLGISADELTPQLAQYFGVKQGKGILVREVTVGSAAEKAGLKAGDVIVSVDGKEVSSVGKLRIALAGESDQKETRKVTLGIVREKREQSLTVELQVPEKLGPRQVAKAEPPALGSEDEDWAAEVAEQAREYAEQAKELEAGANEVQEEFQQHQDELRQQQEELQQEQQKLLEQQKHLQDQYGSFDHQIRRPATQPSAPTRII